MARKILTWKDYKQIKNWNEGSYWYLYRTNKL